MNSVLVFDPRDVFAHLLPRISSRPNRSAAEQSLGMGECHRYSRPHGHCVVCERGSLWITLDGSPLDVVLEAGERWNPDRDSPMLISGLESAGSTYRVLVQHN